jgi:hypothetical protein
MYQSTPANGCGTSTPCFLRCVEQGEIRLRIRHPQHSRVGLIEELLTAAR